ncbi:MAG: penicillin-binding protein 1A, partial [Sagittula sp.]
ASMPKAPSDYHPVRRKERLTQRRDFVLKEMYENGYIDKATYESEVQQPLRSVQNGDFEPYNQALPPRDYFTDEIRRQLSRDFGEDQFFSGGYSVRATLDPEMQTEAAHALQRALEQYDRGLGRWRGTGKTIDAGLLGDEAAWREALAGVRVTRDVTLVSKWHVAVVREVRENSLLIGIEDVPLDDPRGMEVPRADTDWFKGNLFENFEPGDVIHVREMTEDDSGNFIRWTLRQVPQVQGGFMAMDVNTGRVIAMQGGFSYQHSVFNRATQAKRQPGSSFKPFVYAAALDSGYTPATIVVDAPIEIDTPQGVWRPKNASNQFYGPTPLRTGIERSRNLMTIRLAQEVGMDVVANYAEKFGVYDNMGRVLANALGADETTLMRMISAYAMFANGGERVEPTLVDRVQDRYGNTVYSHDAAQGNRRVCVDCADPNIPPGRSPRIVNDRERIMDAITAYQLTSMMEGVVQRGTASGTVKLPVPTAGKTGTTNDAKDVWFIGFTSNIVAGCYIGYDQPRSLGSGASGGGFCGPVFTQFMQKAVKKYGGGPFKVPETCNFVNIDRFSGARLGAGASGANVVAECFREDDLLDGVWGIQLDGGFAISGSFDLIRPEGGSVAREVTTSTGRKAVVGPKAGFGTLSSGGLY